jgi:hypothetical protein
MVDLHLRGARDAEDMWLSSSGDEDEEAALFFCKREDDGGELTRQLLLQTQPASSPGSSCYRPGSRLPSAWARAPSHCRGGKKTTGPPRWLEWITMEGALFLGLRGERPKKWGSEWISRWRTFFNLNSILETHFGLYVIFGCALEIAL